MEPSRSGSCARASSIRSVSSTDSSCAAQRSPPPRPRRRSTLTPAHPPETGSDAHLAPLRERALQDAPRPDAMNLFHSNKSKARALAAAQATQAPPTSSRRGPALPRLFGGGKSIPHSPASYALHTPPVLLPPQAADCVPRWSPSPPQKQYESDGHSSASGHMLSSGTEDGEDSDEDEWTGVELAEDEQQPGGAFLRQNVNFGELLDSSDQPTSEHDDDDNESEVLEITTRFAGPTSPTSHSSSRAGSRKSAASSHRRVSRSASGTPVLEDEPAAWWTSSGSLASLADGNADERADGQPPAIKVRPSKVGLAVDYDASAPDDVDAERLDVTVRGRGRSTSPSLSSYTPGRPSSRTSPPASPDPNESDHAVSPFPSHAGSSTTSDEREASTSLLLEDDAERTPSKLLTAPHVRLSAPASPSLPPISASPTPDSPLDSLAALSVEQEAMALALHVGLAEANRAPLLPRSSSRGAVERDDAESSASSIYSRSSGVASPTSDPTGDMSDTPSRRTRQPSATSVNEHTLHTVATIPSLPTVVASFPPLQTQPTVDPQPADAPAPLVGAVPERRREAKPERKAPILKQKSLQRKPGAGTRVVSEVNPAVPDVGEDPSSRATTAAELETQSADQYADASRSSSHSNTRPRERTPLSASDFAEVYLAFNHSPSPYDAELPQTHRGPPIPITIATVSSPPLPPIPLDGTLPDQFLTPELDEAAHFSTPLTTPLNTSFGSRLQASNVLDLHRRSECFSEMSDDYHDAAMSRTSSTDAPAPLTVITEPLELSLTAPTVTDLAPTPSPTSSSKADGVNPTVASRSDAKARAVAFVADLKRAKMAAASRTATPKASPLSSPVPVQSPFATTPRAAELPLPPVDSHAPAVSPKTPPTVAIPLGPEPSPMKTPKAGLVSPAPTTQSTFSNGETAYRQALSTLSRNRPLPDSMRYREMRNVRTAGERAQIYAQKINALAREDSGTELWITFIRGGPLAHDDHSPSGSPNKSRKSREEASSASTVFPIRGDSYRAKELSTGSFGPRDLQPTVPYPGVLHLARSSKPNNLAKSGFFSLGRKTSRRGSDASQQRYNPSLTSGISGQPLTPTYSAPSSIGRSSLSGPRMPYGAGSAAKSIRGSMISLVPTIDQSEPEPVAFDREALARLSDILPEANRGTLAAFLLQAGNDEALAISMYLAAQQQGQPGRPS